MTEPDIQESYENYYYDTEIPNIFDEEIVAWAIKAFKPFKSPGPDGIFPALLQKAIQSVLKPMVKMFRCSLATGYIPRSWRKSKIIFIPKAGKRPCDLAESLHPIALNSFVNKTKEKIIDKHIRNRHLNENPLHPRQFAYQQGKSTNKAVKSLVSNGY